MKTICGIDEAGRGPIIGSMFIAAVKIDQSKEQNLLNLGVKDSKMLSQLKRERLYEAITEDIADAYKVIKVPPAEIDQAVESEESNLNWLEARHAIDLIDEMKADKSVLDCPSNNIDNFSAFVTSRVKHEAPIICAHKADVDYVVVAAASILAKVHREQEVAKLRAEIGIDFGSGYNTDPKTKKFVEEYWQEHGDIMRKSWSTYKNLAQTKLDGFSG